MRQYLYFVLAEVRQRMYLCTSRGVSVFVLLCEPQLASIWRRIEVCAILRGLVSAAGTEVEIRVLTRYESAQAKRRRVWRC